MGCGQIPSSQLHYKRETEARTWTKQHRRVEYYAERISKGGTNREPEFRLEETGPCSAILHADNAAGQVAAKMGMEHAIKTAQQKGVAVVGISRMGHSGAISYFVQQAARAGLIGISLCQSDPMVVPFGGAEIYYGTNPLAFAAPGEGDEILTFDMATTVQAWGKVLDARSRNMSIPDTWAVDKNGAPTTDPFAVHALLPAAGRIYRKKWHSNRCFWWMDR